MTDEPDMHVVCKTLIANIKENRDRLVADLTEARAATAKALAEKWKILGIIRQQFIDAEVDPYDGNVEELVKLGMKPLTRDIVVMVQFTGHVEFTFEGVSCLHETEQFARDVRERLDLRPDWADTERILSELLDQGCSVTEQYIDKSRITTEEIT